MPEAAAMAAPMDFFDPHFHVWDVAEGNTGGFDGSILFAPGGIELHSIALYEGSLAAAGRQLAHRGGVEVEAVSVCHPAVPGADPKFRAACVAEAGWVRRQLGGAAAGRQYAQVATVALEAPDVAEVLVRVRAGGWGRCAPGPTRGQAEVKAAAPETRGIRQIVNFEPNWPRQGLTGDLLADAAWRRGYGLLEGAGLSFDAQLNPHQFKAMAALAAQHPGTAVVINHMGCPTMADLTTEAARFWEGLQALASASPNVSIKISMLCYADKDWDTKPAVVDAVHRVRPRRAPPSPAPPLAHRRAGDWHLWPRTLHAGVQLSRRRQGRLAGGAPLPRLSQADGKV